MHKWGGKGRHFYTGFQHGLFGAGGNQWLVHDVHVGGFMNISTFNVQKQPRKEV